MQDMQTLAYKNLKESLGFSNKDLLDFMKMKIVKEYDGDNDIYFGLNGVKERKKDDL
jgi:hypothetical protein